MENMSGPHDPGDFTEALFDHFTTDQTVNSFDVPARIELQETVIAPWKAASIAAGHSGLAPSLAPFRLLGIVNRIDQVR